MIHLSKPLEIPTIRLKTRPPSGIVEIRAAKRERSKRRRNPGRAMPIEIGLRKDLRSTGHGCGILVDGGEEGGCRVVAGRGRKDG